MMKKKLLTVGLGIGFSLACTFAAFAAGWHQEADGRYWYENEDGTYAKGMKQIDGKTYIFDDYGYMKTGWDYYNWNYYYLDQSGAVTVGWVQVDGKWYYMNGEGVMQKGFITLDGEKYYLDVDTGAMATGLFVFEGYRYQAADDGTIITGKTMGDIKYDRDGRITYYNDETRDWDYMPDEDDTMEVVKSGLATKYEEGSYYSNQRFEQDAYENLSAYMTDEEIAEFINEVESINEDIYDRNADRYDYFW